MFGSKLEVKRFEDRIAKYEAMPVQTGKILFYGHSLFTRCSHITIAGKDNPMLEDEVRMKDGSQAIVNHGFGTSSADDLLYYYDRMVRPYKPRALVLATMNNDAGFGYSAKDIMEIQARIINWAQADFPGIRIYCFSAMPTKSQKGIVTASTRIRDEYNQYLEDFCARTENCIYVPLINQAFLFSDPADIGDPNKVNDAIYSADNVHMNPQGYALFMDFIRELLDDLL